MSKNVNNDVSMDPPISIVFQSMNVSLLQLSNFAQYSIVPGSKQHYVVSVAIVPMNCACFMDWSILDAFSIVMEPSRDMPTIR